MSIFSRKPKTLADTVKYATVSTLYDTGEVVRRCVLSIDNGEKEYAVSTVDGKTTFKTPTRITSDFEDLDALDKHVLLYLKQLKADVVIKRDVQGTVYRLNPESC